MPHFPYFFAPKSEDDPDDADKSTENPLERLAAEIHKLHTELESVRKSLSLPKPPELPKLPPTPRLPRFGSSKTPVRTMDTRTGKIYHSKNAAGQAVGPELGLAHGDPYAYYKVMKAFPGRLQEVK